jgi:hypothetical protein
MATASKSVTALEFLPFVTTISVNRFMHIRSNRSTPVLYWKQRGFPLCRTVRRWDWLRFAPLTQAFLPCPPPRGGLASFRIFQLPSPRTPPDWLRFAHLAFVKASPATVPACARPPADWLRFAFSVCLRPAHLPIGFVSHLWPRHSCRAPRPGELASFRTGPWPLAPGPQSPPCAPNHTPSRAGTSMFPTRTQAFKLYCGYRGMA